MIKYRDHEFTREEFYDLATRLAEGLIVQSRDFKPSFAMGRAQEILEFYISDTHNKTPNRRYRKLMADWFAKEYPSSVNHWLDEVPWNEPND